MKITLIGTGYVGLVSGVIFSSVGHNVTCIDIDDDKIKLLNQSKAGIYEPQLEELMTDGLKNKLLQFTTSYKNIHNADVIFIAVGTPQFENGDADLRFVYNAMDTISPLLNPKTIIAIKSTVPPQTCQKIALYLKEHNNHNEVVMNPEFLREGSAVHDFLNPERIVIGCSSVQAKEVMQKVYQKWGNTERIFTDTTTAEMIKYASNTFLAAKIAFINEMANICEKIGANIEMLSHGMGTDKRIGKDFLKVGPGFGGSCFPKDINALIHLVNKQKIESTILPAILESNDKRKFLMVKKIKAIVGENLSAIKIGVLGLTFKAGTDDVRHSPAIEIIELLLADKASIIAFDPHGIENAKAILPEIEYTTKAEDVADKADCIIVLTEWDEFKSLDFDLIRKKLRQPNIIDLRNLLDATSMAKNNLSYHKLG
jgi:UDPglucose 6-dehydrogenase